MKLMVKSTTILFVLLLFMPLILTLHAQTVVIEESQLTVSGTIISKIDNSSIGFANIGVENSLRGTAADENGQFILRIPSSMAEKALVVSAIGFESISVPIATLRDRDEPMDIELTPTQYQISQINVNAQSLILYGMLKKAVAKIPEVYVSSPLRYTYSYKNQLIVGSVNRRSEGFGYLYDSVGYQRQTLAEAFVSRSYEFKGINRNYKNTPFLAGLNNMDDLLAYDVVRSRGNVLDVDHLANYSLELVSIKNYLGDTIYIIGFKNLNPNLVTTGDAYSNSYEGEVYLNLSEQSIIKILIRGERQQESIHGKSFLVSGSKDTFGEKVMYDVVTTYQKKNDKFMLSSINYSMNFIRNGKDKGKSVTHFAITDIKPLITEFTDSRDYFENTTRR